MNNFKTGFDKVAKNQTGTEDNKEMALSDLSNIARKAAYLHKLMAEVKDVPPWVIEKLGIARDNLGSLMDFLAPKTKENPFGKMKE